MLVSEMPGTTRDAVDTLLKWHKRDYRIVDTAGMLLCLGRAHSGCWEIAERAGRQARDSSTPTSS